MERNVIDNEERGQGVWWGTQAMAGYGLIKIHTTWKVGQQTHVGHDHNTERGRYGEEKAMPGETS